MTLPRAIPCLLLKGQGLVKTVRFQKPVYLGDPRNVVRIFNEREVDELVLLDIDAPRTGSAPQFDLVEEIVSEAFMPVGYGGGIRDVQTARQMLNLGVEKVIVCSHAVEHPTFVQQLAETCGSQSVVVCLDVRRNLFGKAEVFVKGGRVGTKKDPITLARTMESMGAGELIVNSIDRDGTMSGYDLQIIKCVTEAVNIPVIACGGAGTIEHFSQAVTEGGASAVAAGSVFVFQGPHRAVLINYPDQETLKGVFAAPATVS